VPTTPCTSSWKDNTPMAKMIAFDEEARRGLERGMNNRPSGVGSTLLFLIILETPRMSRNMPDKSAE
jgi:hypothetical protein